MSLDIYFARDIANVLRSTACAGLSAPAPSGGYADAYREGFIAALVAVGLAFGLKAEPGANQLPEWVEPR